MSTLARDPIKPLMFVGSLGYVMMLAAAMIWFHLSPLIVLGMTVGGVALMACTLRPILAIHGLIMLLHCHTPLAESALGDIAAQGMGVIIVLSWILHMAVNRKKNMQLDGLLLLMMLFVLWSGLLIMISIDVEAAVSRTLTFFQLVVSAALFSTVIDNPKKLRGIYRTIVAWTTFSACIGLARFFSGSPEAEGLISNRNLFAVYLNIALVCSYLLYQSARKPLEKLLLAMSIPVMLLALALTFSRAGLIVLGATMLFVFARAARERRFTILFVSTALIAILAVLLPGSFWNRAGTIVPSLERQENTVGIRVNLWKAGMRMVSDHPIRGVGPGNFIAALPRYSHGITMTRHLGAHNSYVSVAAEQGLIGLALFLLIHFIALRRIHRASAVATRSGDAHLARLALTAEACIVIIMLSAMSGTLENKKYLWIFFGLAMAISRFPGLIRKAREVDALKFARKGHYNVVMTGNLRQ